MFLKIECEYNFSKTISENKIDCYEKSRLLRIKYNNRYLIHVPFAWNKVAKHHKNIIA